jgi:hypothetical protein
MASESSDDGHQSAAQHPPNAFCCLRCHRGCSFDWRANETASVDEAQTRAIDDCWRWCASTQHVMGDWVGWMRQSTSFDLDSIRLVIEAMGGGGDVTINWTEGWHRREEGSEEWRHNNYFEPGLLKAINGWSSNNQHQKQGFWAANVSNKNTTNTKQQSTAKRETGFADMLAVCTSCVSQFKSDNEYLTRH